MSQGILYDQSSRQLISYLHECLKGPLFDEAMYHGHPLLLVHVAQIQLESMISTAPGKATTNTTKAVQLENLILYFQRFSLPKYPCL